MLLINAGIALMAMILTFTLYYISELFLITGGPLILLGTGFFFVYLFLSDIIEVKMIEYFNRDPAE